MPAIRVLVVDDSALIRQMLTHALSLDPRIEVVGIARNGVEAVERVRDLHPDVVTLDVQMPEMDGLDALRYIHRDSQARVLMLSSMDDPDTTYQALSAGAVDFIPKPKQGFATSLSELSDYLIKKIKTAYRISPEKRRAAGAASRGATNLIMPAVLLPPGSMQDPQRIVALAASTGGPPALEEVFSGLPGDVSAAYVVVQHLPAGFTASLARRLGRISGISVVEAENGMRVEAGSAYMAPHGTHMRVEGRPGRLTRLVLEDGPNLHGVKPSADPLFESAAADFGAKATGVVLTGMGSDGARGLLAIKDAGGRTIAQDEATSTVWGMPGAAVKLGAAQVVVPLERVATEVRRSVREGL
ncbi:MAG: chemotaxis response regulator protein-glutamate methylesterase [Coriobacteriia bacterium]|nr:chemotaxis response regulator protein-glutamate methylesterase [Coriobacteriia bacterium]